MSCVLHGKLVFGLQTSWPWLGCIYVFEGKKIDKQQSFQTHTQSFTLRELRSASKNFSKKIGEGGFGPVFYGKLATGQEIAIKVSSGISKQGHLEFFNEVRVDHIFTMPCVGKEILPFCTPGKSAMQMQSI